MENVEMAALMEELADLMEIGGANTFRVRAWRNASATVGSLSRSITSMVEAGEDLKELPAVGTDIAAALEELAREGTFSRMDEVTAEVPRSLGQLVRLDGVGPKKARRLWEELGVLTVDQLEGAVREGKVAALEGFGPRSADKILRSIGDYRLHQSRFLLVDADELVSPVVARLRETPGVEQVEVAGSFRRRKETVGDVDILALYELEDTSPVMRAFTTAPGVARVESSGGTRARVVLRSGLPVDLRILPRRAWGAALHYFTGSKEHNVAIRTLGVRKGLRISEYGVFRVTPEEPSGGKKRGGTEPDGTEPDGTARAGEEAVASGVGDGPGVEEGERIGGEREEDVFAAVGLPWIPPELRRGSDEIDRARKGTLPELVTLEDIRGDLQMHTTWSDGADSVEEMARACLQRGYAYLALTDHSGGQLAMVQGLTPEKVRGQRDEVARVQAAVPEIAILRSCEVDIRKDGALDLNDEVLAELDLVLVSVHTSLELDRTAMTDRVIRALENPHVDILAHPTGRILNRRQPHAMDVEEVLKAAAALGVAVELNANPHRLDLRDVHAERACELGIPVVISTDAHSVRHLPFMRYGVDQARRAGLEAADVLNTRTLPEFRAWLARPRPGRPEGFRTGRGAGTGGGAGDGGGE